jgi:hypothetical protein
MTTIVIKNFDYLVISTGYTARILTITPADLNLSEEESDEESTDSKATNSSPRPRQSSSDEESDDETDLGEEGKELEAIKYWKRRGAIFIHDDLWGRGLYPIGSDKQEIDDILDQLPNNMNGVICFKCKSLGTGFNIAAELMKLNYCGFFTSRTLYMITYITMNNGKKVCVLTYDCESG